MRRVPNLCRGCLRYQGDGTCRAFPEGIPAEILLLGGDHREPVEGDHGLQFLPGSSEQQTEAISDWQSTFE